jgi:hypothetical protein
VTIGHEFGTTVEATQSVSPEDRIIVDPSDALANGVKSWCSEVSFRSLLGGLKLCDCNA